MKCTHEFDRLVLIYTILTQALTCGAVCTNRQYLIKRIANQPLSCQHQYFSPEPKQHHLTCNIYFTRKEHTNYCTSFFFLQRSKWIIHQKIILSQQTENRSISVRGLPVGPLMASMSCSWLGCRIHLIAIFNYSICFLNRVPSTLAS